jgi:hypothetical protein
MAFYPIIYLVIYNFDNIILKKYNRHLIYTVKYNVVWVDDESENAKSLTICSSFTYNGLILNLGD